MTTLKKMNSQKNLGNPHAHTREQSSLQFASPMLPANEDKKKKEIPKILYDYKAWEENWEVN
jgi:hypothetical protein